MLQKYNPEQINDALQSLNSKLEAHWCIKENKLYKKFVFKDFIIAFEFMRQVATAAEQANHHPEWSNVYNKVEINLVTHEVDGISSRDFELAQTIELILKTDKK